MAKFNESESESLRNIFEDRNRSQQELEKVEKQIQVEINETQNLLRIGPFEFGPCIPYNKGHTSVNSEPLKQ